MKTIYYIQNTTTGILETNTYTVLNQATATLRTYPPNYRIVIQYVVDPH